MNIRSLNFGTIQVALLFFVVLMASFSSCKKDEKTVIQLNHDSENVDSPNLPGNTYEAAARFSTTMMEDYSGESLIEVEYYIQDVPNSTKLIVYKGSTSGAPGSVVYTSTLTGSVKADSWNKHTLSEPLVLDGSDLWLSIEFTHSDSRQVMGCDQGPAVSDGDYFYDSATGLWQKFSVQFPAISINWNIRGKVQIQE